MISQRLDLNGTQIHRPGTLIGKKLEQLEKGVGETLTEFSLRRAKLRAFAGSRKSGSLGNPQLRAAGNNHFA